jgi:hypothetical protein
MPLIQLDVGRVGVVILQHRLNQQERICQATMGNGSLQRSLGITGTQLAILDVGMMISSLLLAGLASSAVMVKLLMEGRFSCLKSMAKAPSSMLFQGDGRRLDTQLAFCLRERLLRGTHHRAAPLRGTSGVG